MQRMRYKLLLVGTIIFWFSGCSFYEGYLNSADPIGSCADPTIHQAFSLHNAAKGDLARFYHERKDYLLYDAFYSARESKTVARFCF